MLLNTEKLLEAKIPVKDIGTSKKIFKRITTHNYVASIIWIQSWFDIYIFKYHQANLL